MPGGAAHEVHHADAALGGLLDVGLLVVADVQHLRGLDPEAFAGGVEDAGVGLGAAVLARAELEAEHVHQPDPFQVGVAVAERGQRHPRGHPVQRVQAVLVVLDLAARGEEGVERRLREGDVIARFLEHAFERDQPLAGEIVRQLRMFPRHRVAQLGHALQRPALGGAWRIGAQPVGQDALGAHDDRRDRPDGIVKVEGDGADPEAHGPIVSPVIPAGGPSRPGRRSSTARS